MDGGQCRGLGEHMYNVLFLRGSTESGEGGTLDWVVRRLPFPAYIAGACQSDKSPPRWHRDSNAPCSRLFFDPGAGREVLALSSLAIPPAVSVVVQSIYRVPDVEGGVREEERES